MKLHSETFLAYVMAGVDAEVVKAGGLVFRRTRSSGELDPERKGTELYKRRCVLETMQRCTYAVARDSPLCSK